VSTVWSDSLQLQSHWIGYWADWQPQQHESVYSLLMCSRYTTASTIIAAAAAAAVSAGASSSNRLCWCLECCRCACSPAAIFYVVQANCSSLTQSHAAVSTNIVYLSTRSLGYESSTENSESYAMHHRKFGRFWSFRSAGRCSEDSPVAYSVVQYGNHNIIGIAQTFRIRTAGRHLSEK